MKHPKISIIVATGRNREIGAKNKLLWKIPEELKRFREVTFGHPIIMGRKTHESIGRVLPGRTNIVVTRKIHLASHPKGGSTDLVFVNSLEAALREAEKAESQKSSDREVFVIGGAQIFEQALPLADKLYVTLVDADFPEADSFFPEYEDEFTEKVFEKFQESFGYKYNFFRVGEIIKLIVLAFGVKIL